MSSATLPTAFRTQALSGYAYAAAAAVLWSLIGPFTKNCLALGVSAMETAFWRALLGCLCFAGQTVLAGKLRVPLRDAVIFFLFGCWGIGALFSTLQIGIDLSGAAMTMVLLYTAPAWVAIFSRVLFKETISNGKLAAIGIALAGVALVCFSGGSLASGYSALGTFCGLVSGLAFASQFPFYVWWSGRYTTATMYTYMLLGGTAFMLLFTDFAPAKPLDAWGNLVALGVLTNYGAYVCLARSLRLISQVQSAVVGNIEPVLAALWVWLFFGENFSVYGWLGSALVVGAVFLLTLEKKPAA